MDDIDILVVEDSPTQARWLAMVLQERGIRHRMASDGVEALDLVSMAQPDLVLTDVRMPRMDGYELCRRIKSDDATSHIVVVLLTTLSRPTDVLLAVKCGADNFVTKPYEPDFLISRLEQTLRNRERELSGEGVYFAGEYHAIPGSDNSLLLLLLSTYEEAVLRNRALEQSNNALNRSLSNLEKLQGDYKAILERSADGIVVCNPDGVVQFANPASAHLLGRPVRDLLDRTFDYPVVAGSNQEVQVRRGATDPLVIEMRVTSTSWEGRQSHLVSMRDITHIAREREQLETLAETDGLTGLFNRRGFLAAGNRVLTEARSSGRGVSVFFLDMDGLKEINDKLGHQEGDRAIKDLARLLENTFRETDVIGRLGGDEFAVLAPRGSHASSQGLRDRLERNLRRQGNMAGRLYRLSASIGIVLGDPRGSEDLSALLDRADNLMYLQKRTRKRSRSLAGGDDGHKT